MVESFFAVTGCTCQCIGNQSLFLHLLFYGQRRIVGGTWIPSATNFYCHIIHQINTFYSSFIFIFATFMESRHRIIEMSCMGISYLESCIDVFKFCLCMSYRARTPFEVIYLPNQHSSRKFGSSIPTFDTMSFFQRECILLDQGSFIFSGICPLPFSY